MRNTDLNFEWEKVTVLVMVFLNIIHLAIAQVDYVPHPQFISTTKPSVRIDWVHSADGRYVIDFNHTVEFIPLMDERLNSTRVLMDLYKNDERVKHFDFPVGSGVRNRIQIPLTMELKRGDAVYFILHLQPETESEKYIFNIFYYESERTENKYPPRDNRPTGLISKVEEESSQLASPGRLKKSTHKVKGSYKVGYYSRKSNIGTGWVDVLGFLLGLD